MNVIYRWIPREINEGADAMTHVARDHKQLFDPCSLKSSEEWILFLKPLFFGFFDFIKIVGECKEDHDCMDEAWALKKFNAYERMSRTFGLMKGDRAYYSTHDGMVIKNDIGDSATSTAHTGEEWKDRWNEIIKDVDVVAINNIEDMNQRSLDATSRLQRLKWNMPSLIKEMRNEGNQLPNPYLIPEKYIDKLSGYPELNTIVKIARHGVEVHMKSDFRAPRPWKGNYVRDELAIQLVIKEFVKLYNAGRGLLVDAKSIAKEIGNVVVSPVGAVPKGGKPLSEALRVIGGLSSPAGKSNITCNLWLASGLTYR